MEKNGDSLNQRHRIDSYTSWTREVRDTKRGCSTVCAVSQEWGSGLVGQRVKVGGRYMPLTLAFLPHDIGHRVEKQ